MSIRIEPNPAGIAALEAEIERACRERAVRAVAEIASVARAEAPVDTGQMAASIRADSSGLKVTVGTNHWMYVEYGTRHMAPQPFMRPAIAAVAARG